MSPFGHSHVDCYYVCRYNAIPQKNAWKKRIICSFFQAFGYLPIGQKAPLMVFHHDLFVHPPQTIGNVLHQT